MLKKTLDGIPFYEFEIFQQFRGGLKHAVFTRHSDIFSASPLQRVLDTATTPVQFNEQLHGTSTWMVEKEEAFSLRPFKKGDALMTRYAEIPLVIRIADCASILLFDPIQKVVANVHAGWRGMVQRIIHTALLQLAERFGCKKKNILAGISPMLGPCCSRFSNPEKELPRFLHSYILGENMVDLWSIVEGQLRECGIMKDHIENPRMCTLCNPEDFYSYRREPGVGRFGTAIMLK